MSDQKDKSTADSSDRTVIDLKGSEQHHDLKNQPGEQGDRDHAKSDASVDSQIKKAVKGKDDDGALASAMKKAVNHEE